MALFGNDMFGHHMVSHGHNQGFGQGKSSFGSGHASHDPNTNGHIGNHSIFGRQKSLLNDMTSSKHDKSKPYVFSSYSYPYDYHHEGMASMFEKPMEVAKKRPVLQKQQSYSVGDKPELKRAPSFASNPKLMRSKTINPSDAPTRPRPLKLSRSLSIADDQSAPVNMDLALSDFQRRSSEKVKKRTQSDPSDKPKKKTWPDIVKRISRKKKSSKDKSRKSTNSTDDSARESMGSTSSVGTFDGPRHSADTPGEEERPRCDTIESKLSRGSIRSSISSDFDKEQEKLILSLLSNDLTNDFSQEDVFENRVPSTESDNTNGNTNQTSELTHDYQNDKDTTSTPYFDPLQPIDNDNEDEEQQRNYSESPTLVLRRIKHLHPQVEPESASVKSTHSGRMSPRSYFSDTSEPSSSNRSRQHQRKTKKDQRNGTVVMYADPSDSEASGAHFDFPSDETPIPPPKKPTVLTNASKLAMDEKKIKPREQVAVLAEPSKQTEPQRQSVHDIIKNFQSLKTSPEKDKPKDSETNDTPVKEDYKPNPFRKPYVAPKVFTVSSPPPYRPFTSIYSKPVSPGYERDKVADNQVTVQDVSLKYSSPLKVETEGGKDSNGIDNLTADSSESGYGTSHIANSPKGYDNMKVLNFVNSLPNHSDMEEQNSELSHDELVMNGSETESIEDNESEIYEPASDLSNVKCVSGSDTDTASINSNISESQLEVTKLLESPTEVCERVTNDMSRHSNQSSPSVIYRQMSDQSIRKPTPISEPVLAPLRYEQPLKSYQPNKVETQKLKRDTSETELLKVFDGEKKLEAEFHDVHDTPFAADVEVVVSKPKSMAPMAESKLYRGPDPSENSLMYASKSSRPISYASSRQYSTIQESNLTQCIDALLHLLNCLLVICSAGVIGTGMWLLMKDFNVNHVTIILGNNLLQVIVYVSISGAAVAILAALCLCCGIKKDKYGLSFFAIVLIIVIIAFSSAAILSAIFADKLQGIEFRVNFKERLISKYGNISETDRENEYFTASWDTMQKLFECCGAEGEVSDMASWAVFKKFSIWYRKQPFKAHIYVPESCCKKNMNLEVCQGSDHNLLGPPVYGPPMDNIYSHENPNLNTTGCYDFFASYLARLTTIVAIVMGGLAAMYFLTVMLTWVFCFKKNQDYEDYLYGSFYEMGNEEDNMDYRSNYHTEHEEVETKFTATESASARATTETSRMDRTDDTLYGITDSRSYHGSTFKLKQNSQQTQNPNNDLNSSHSPNDATTHYNQIDPSNLYSVVKNTTNNGTHRESELSYPSTYPVEESLRKPAETVYQRLNKTRLEDQIIPNTFQHQQGEHVDKHNMQTTQDNVQESDDDSTDSDTDREDDVGNKCTTFRRNLWLSSESGRAVNLLSIAIEEEDSNFEDSDAEDTKAQNFSSFKPCQ